MEKREVSILGVITARGGSKSIYKKSIAPCAGYPLMYYTIMAAQESSLITRLVLSTDDEEMAAYARGFDIEIRPEHLPEDKPRCDLVLFQYVLEQFKKDEYVPDIVVHLRPTTPLKTTADIDRGIQLMLDHPEADSVRSVCAPLHTPFKMYRVRQQGPYIEPILKQEFPEVYREIHEPFNMPRQMLPPILRHSGYVDVVRSHIISAGSMSGEKILPLPIEEWRDIDIDSSLDLEYASWLIRRIFDQGKVPWIHY